MPLTPVDFDRRVVPGARAGLMSGSGTVSEPLRAELFLPSGEVVASGWRWEGIGFTEIAPPGRYPVLLYSLLPEGGESWAPDPLAVRLVIRDAPVVSWSMALLPGQDPAELSEDGFFGFAVDGGEGNLIDAQCLRELHDTGTYLEFVDDAKIDLDFGDRLASSEDDEGRETVGFKIGSDGVYPTWIGRTEDGELACYLIELLLFDNRD
ncbi:DUF4241 domain-containing protein [Lentzea sp. JNUCC 0626]|uniref:DUF4241 domain-containing protein n=1 Tax=Lentzea sp. JNUCC 0626 TaxID=3367513 RepID=UPI0037488BA5